MIDANKGTSEETLRRLKQASYERFSIELVKAVEKLLEDFEMTWDDLAGELCWDDGNGSYLSGDEIKKEMGLGPMGTDEINAIAHVFSKEPYILFRPRKPYTQS